MFDTVTARKLCGFIACDFILHDLDYGGEKVKREIIEERTKRAAICQEIINTISSIGRRFFYYEKADRIARIYVAKNGRVKFKDDYFNEEFDLHASAGRRCDKFSHGGTMKGLIMDMKEFIVSSGDTNNNNGYGGLYCPHWGYSKEDMAIIQKKAIDVGYLKPMS